MHKELIYKFRQSVFYLILTQALVAVTHYSGNSLSTFKHIKLIKQTDSDHWFTWQSQRISIIWWQNIIDIPIPHLLKFIRNPTPTRPPWTISASESAINLIWIPHQLPHKKALIWSDPDPVVWRGAPVPAGVAAPESNLNYIVCFIVYPSFIPFLSRGKYESEVNLMHVKYRGSCQVHVGVCTNHHWCTTSGVE